MGLPYSTVEKKAWRTFIRKLVNLSYKGCSRKKITKLSDKDATALLKKEQDKLHNHLLKGGYFSIIIDG